MPGNPAALRLRPSTLRPGSGQAQDRHEAAPFLQAGLPRPATLMNCNCWEWWLSERARLLLLDDTQDPLLESLWSVMPEMRLFGTARTLNFDLVTGLNFSLYVERPRVAPDLPLVLLLQLGLSIPGSKARSPSPRGDAPVA